MGGMSRIVSFFFITLCLPLLLYCPGRGTAPGVGGATADMAPASVASEGAGAAGGAVGGTESGYLPGADDLSYARYRKEAAAIAALMDDRFLASQVLLVGLDNKNFLSIDNAAILRNAPPGGIMFFKYNLDAEKDRVRSFLGECSNLVVAAGCGIAPFLAVDHEGGLVHRFGPGIEKLPPAASFWELAEAESRAAALEAIEELASLSAVEMRDLGISMNLAPVAEILNDDNKYFLETRSYGPDSGFTEEAASAFIRGMDAAGIACVVKHFPGNSSEDPHSGTPSISAGKPALDEMVKPFAAAIENLRCPAVMVSHVMVPAVDPLRNASLSPLVLDSWLRDELGFEGIIMADDFAMGAVAASRLSPASAAVEALIAGADMVMAWPLNIGAVYGAILGALEDGYLPRRRLVEAVERILAEKIRYNIIIPGKLP
jgi:beta-N-acetylhexosaminidase